ncbi:ABC transporter ATP-binding protein [Streptococcus saliviloxodontae]|uniref:ABC-type multidrug transport system ATPase subunit n=1 Tax=Streptococcus saliviloxodontae TaxID=1349416 RepID=A0ABS2PM66_9STRE|nr:ABC transporter ATP-binding protein [Streptococcus saliviloxodontae]MBM7636036.1 ABC-type multidrug transport system ATPase subunit [Streptococcus saliviloxodontae]
MLTINNLTFSYDSETNIFSNFNFFVKEGEFVCLEGENGTGKTTLLNIIAGLTYSPNMDIEMFNEKISQNELKNSVIYVPTKPEFYNDFTVEEFIELIYFLWKQEKQFKAQVKKNIDLLGLTFSPNQNVGSFSLGMQYKLYLCAFLAIPRKIILLDEPFNALDINSREIAIAMVKEYVRHNSGACIFSSHVRETINSLKTRVVPVQGENL